jgi:hypothetical protein
MGTQFQGPPSAFDIFVAYGVGATALLRQLARKPSEHNFMPVGACKRLAFQSLSVEMQTAKCGSCDGRELWVPVLPSSTTKISETYG